MGLGCREKTWPRRTPWLSCSVMPRPSPGASNFMIRCQLRAWMARFQSASRSSIRRHTYDQYWDGCNEPYSSRKRKGPSLQGVFRREYFTVSGMPANDQRARDLILFGRDKMPGYSQELTTQQVDDVLAYLHTL